MTAVWKNRSVVVVGRASTGIYLILSTYPLQKPSVLVPANLCYAGIYPALYAGKKVCFCDVNPVTGNVTPETFAAGCGEDVSAAIVPHMYGQPVAGLEKIAAFCRQRQILLIEDCAASMGAYSDAYALGYVGDYTIYSTGYAKTLDLGGGGLVCASRQPLEPIADLEKALPVQSHRAEQDSAFFSKLYRFLRNEASDTDLEKWIYKSVPEWMKSSFLYSISDEKKRWILDRLSQLEDVVAARQTAFQEYARKWDHTFTSSAYIRRYPFSKGAVPWRWNIFAERDLKQAVIAACLEKRLPVSDWYPVVTPMFQSENIYQGASWHEERILNFPLPANGELISAIIDIICGVTLRIEKDCTIL